MSIEKIQTADEIELAPEIEHMDHPPGFYWHVHHDAIVEWCYDYDERAEYIRRHKPECDREIRLAAMIAVQGKLPDEVVAAWKAYAEVEKAYVEAGKAYVEAWKAYIEAIAAHSAEIAALHEQECPNCPWDGKTLFPEKAKGD